MSEIHLRQLGFTYSACGPFRKNKERVQKFNKTGDSQHIYQNKLNKVCFQHDMAYGDINDLTRRTVLIKYCVIKYLILLKIRNMMDIKNVFLQWSKNFFGEKNF